MCPTFLIGCLPTYAHVGWISTALLVVLRLLQGIAIGGEYVSALVFSMEHAPGHQKTISGALMRLGTGHWYELHRGCACQWVLPNPTVILIFNRELP